MAMFEAKWGGSSGRVVVLLVQVMVAACCFLLSMAAGNLAASPGTQVTDMVRAAKP